MLFFCLFATLLTVERLVLVGAVDVKELVLVIVLTHVVVVPEVAMGAGVHLIAFHVPVVRDVLVHMAVTVAIAVLVLVVAEVQIVLEGVESIFVMVVLALVLVDALVNVVTAKVTAPIVLVPPTQE